MNSEKNSEWELRGQEEDTKFQKREMPLGAGIVTTFRRIKDSRRGEERPTPEVLK